MQVSALCLWHPGKRLEEAKHGLAGRSLLERYWMRRPGSPSVSRVMPTKWQRAKVNQRMRARLCAAELRWEPDSAATFQGAISSNFVTEQANASPLKDTLRGECTTRRSESR